MNKEELKKEIKDRGHIKANSFVLISQHDLSSLIDQLDEPGKIVMPKEFDDWYQGIKNYWKKEKKIAKTMAIMNINKIGFGFLLEDEYGNSVETDSIGEYGSLRDYIISNGELCTRAILDGYEVEKPLYHMPLPYQSNSTIYYYKQDDGKISFKQGGMMKDHSKFTQEELDKYFPEIKHMAVEVQE